MMEAFDLALKGFEKGEVPIGAVMVRDEKIISRQFNRVEELKDSSAHAEILAVRDSSEKLKNSKLVKTSLYVTLEPCIMCMSSLAMARVDNIYFGAFDKRFGFLSTGCSINLLKRFNKNIVVEGGFFKEQSSYILKTFFKILRERE
ncbi:MAG: tRNA-specific adenosine deaminase [Candidatus Cloacimonadota bacterium]|nr:MAG: tRNA-specific adenosine deaminase [Candidatus Cloacimonadota bacterium]